MRLQDGREIVVAFADHARDDLCWTGWPHGYSPISAVELVAAASDEEHYTLVAELIRQGGYLGDKVRSLHGAGLAEWRASLSAMRMG